MRYLDFGTFQIHWSPNKFYSMGGEPIKGIIKYLNEFQEESSPYIPDWEWYILEWAKEEVGGELVGKPIRISHPPGVEPIY
jgi:hypothetical protein